MNKAIRNWRLAWQLCKFYIEPHYPRDIRNRGMKINLGNRGHLYPDLVVNSIEEDRCLNCDKILVSQTSYIRCDILGRSDSAFFCSRSCVIEYSHRNPDLRITEDPDGYGHKFEE